jgi:glutamate/tyrosine decarboxylase-like PLP-dependent enzyme
MTHLEPHIARVLAAMSAWESRWGAFVRHPSLEIPQESLERALETYTSLLEGNYPFFHPRYAGQMLKPPHPAAIAAYLAAMLVNPNNHALDGGPPTGAMEKEVVRDLAHMFRFPEPTLGHLTSSGTIANLEALWVAREEHPEKGVAYSSSAHYTHGRMSQVLRLPATALPSDDLGHVDVEAVERALASGEIGTVVLTAGTTGLGAVDPIADVLELRRRYDFRIHVDAAYGGFYVLLAHEASPLLAPDVQRHLRAIRDCDSVAIDPHKHGLQPYGCGCVLFRDPAVGRHYRHDSPYTYFTSNELHLGEISLECSRAGAAAGALWLTLQVLPLTADRGLGAVLAACLRAARAMHHLLADSARLVPYAVPELDIVAFLPRLESSSASAIDRAAIALFQTAMNDDDPVFLSTLRVGGPSLGHVLGGYTSDQPSVRILRSVLMKPEHEEWVRSLVSRLDQLASQTT